MNRRVDVSVIVCTYNRAEMLGDALASLACLQTDSQFSYEVVVVDNASTDHTSQVVDTAISQAGSVVRSLHEPLEGVAHARNRGVNEARGEWIAFFDDDQLAEPGWLLQLVTAARQQQVRCVGGAVRLRLPADVQRDLAPMVRVLLSETVGAKSARFYDRKFAPGTGNLLLHHSVFDDVGLFRTEFQEAGEDTDLFRRIRAQGIRAYYTPHAIVHHVTPPYRLKEEYLSWTALRAGGHVARRERDDWGPMFPLVSLARLGQTWLLFGPRVLITRLCRNAEIALDAKCWWWHGNGYLRFAMRFMFPSAFAQKRYLAQLVFRNERQTLQES